MSRYIRTKDGRIYDLKSKEISSIEYIDKNTAINEYKVECAFYTIYYYNGLKGHYLECDNKGGYSCDFIEEKDIMNQADTIEELCDEAVAVYPDGTHDNCSVMHIVDNNGFCEAVYGCLSVSVDDLKKKYECWEIYGAIWTNKGLIYVAKMNEKGELELI